jgi:hypothetical protein
MSAATPGRTRHPKDSRIINRLAALLQSVARIVYTLLLPFLSNAMLLRMSWSRHSGTSDITGPRSRGDGNLRRQTLRRQISPT